MKKSKWMPVAFFLVGVAFYVYYGIEYPQTWMVNLPNIVIYALIVAALYWALRRKEKYAEEREKKE